MERHGTACITGTDLRARSVAGRRSASMVGRSFGAMSVAGHPSASMVGGGLSARSAKLPKKLLQFNHSSSVRAKLFRP